MKAGVERDLARTLIAAGGLLALVGGTLWVLQPFLGPAIWATMVVVASWPMMRWLQQRLGDRRTPAVVLMTVLLLLGFVVPLTLALVTIAGNADRLVEWARLAASWEMPEQPPAWLTGLPMVGGMLGGLWEQASAAGLRGLVGRLTPYAGDVTRWVVGEVGSLGKLLLQFLLTVLIASLLYARGESAATLALRLAARVAGPRGEDAVVLAGQAIRGVALGVGITAMVQSLIAGSGLALAGVPFAGLLTAVVFMLCIAQLGPIPVLVPAIAWLFWADRSGWAVFLIVVAVVVTTLDNVLRPLLIRMGADLPLLLIFAGVIGGLLGFGLIGIFVGPVVLAVAYRLLGAWLDDAPPGRDHRDAGPD